MKKVNNAKSIAALPNQVVIGAKREIVPAVKSAVKSSDKTVKVSKSKVSSKKIDFTGKVGYKADYIRKSGYDTTNLVSSLQTWAANRPSNKIMKIKINDKHTCSATSLLRALGASGVSYDKTVKIMHKLKCEARECTIKTHHYVGASGRKDLKIEVLSKDELNKLVKLAA